MVSATSMLVIETKMNAISVGSELQQVQYTQYLAKFGLYTIEILINSNNKINVIQPSFAKKLDFCV